MIDKYFARGVIYCLNSNYNCIGKQLIKCILIVQLITILLILKCTFIWYNISLTCSDHHPPTCLSWAIMQSVILYVTLWLQVLCFIGLSKVIIWYTFSMPSHNNCVPISGFTRSNVLIKIAQLVHSTSGKMICQYHPHPFHQVHETSQLHKMLNISNQLPTHW